MPQTTAIPDTVEGFQEFMRDRARVESALGDGTFGDVIEAYVNQVQARDRGIDDQVMTEVQRVLADWMRENEVALNRQVNLADVRDRRPPNSVYNAHAPGAAVDAIEGMSHADFLRATAPGEIVEAFRDSRYRDLREQIRNASSTDPSDGGFLIPETMRSQILQVALETAIVRPRATVIPMETLRVPIPMIDSTTNVGSVYGGIVAYWTEEAAALTQSDIRFGRVALEAKKLTAYTEAPRELLRDSMTSFEGLINQTYPRAVAFFEDLAFFSGTGVGEPLGWLNGSANISVTRDTSSQVAFVDVVNMYARMLPTSLNSAVWVCSPKVIPQLLQMELSTGSGALWLGGQGNAGASGAPPMSLLGRPLIVSEKNPNLGTAGDLSFVDFGYYLLGDRQQMESASSMDYKFGNDKVAYRVIERVDGRPWIQNAITPANSGDTLSPFVILAA